MATTITGAACTMEEGGKASGAIRRQEDKYKKSPNTKTNTDTKTETLPGEDEVKVS